MQRRDGRKVGKTATREGREGADTRAPFQAVREPPLRACRTLESTAMFDRLGTILGVASLVFAATAGPVTHVHHDADGHAATWHAHFLSSLPHHRQNNWPAFDDDDDHAHVSYLNPFVSIAGASISPVVIVVPVVHFGAPPAIVARSISAPRPRAHAPPARSTSALRGPPRPIFS